MSVGVTTDQKQNKKRSKISRRKYGLNLMCDQKISYGLKRMTLRIWLNIENIYVSRGQKQTKKEVRSVEENMD
jgi:hypothetical protein